jgi:hypothetical protein
VQTEQVATSKVLPAQQVVKEEEQRQSRPTCFAPWASPVKNLATLSLSDIQKIQEQEKNKVKIYFILSIW